MSEKLKKYVVVLAHADGWGALSANQLIRRLHERYPDLGVHLVVSQATKNKEGQIATKIEDLKTPRALKENNLLEYFKSIDALYDSMPSDAELQKILSGEQKPEGVSDKHLTAYLIEIGRLQAGLQACELLTFKQLAKQCCSDSEVHYTTKGGPGGGQEVATIVECLEKQYGHGPEVLLSVDTMAILPKELLDKYQCFSTHPGPLGDIKIEGMQGTLRALANEVLFDNQGVPIPPDYGVPFMSLGHARVKGTMFMQTPELDKGTPIYESIAPVYIDTCAYRARTDLYHSLVEGFFQPLPIFPSTEPSTLPGEVAMDVLLDSARRKKHVDLAMEWKKKVDTHPPIHIEELNAEQLDRWQGKAIGIIDEEAPMGMDVVQSELINPQYFKSQMRRFFPAGNEKGFERVFNRVYGDTLEKLAAQKETHLTDPWARFYMGKGNMPDVTVNPDMGNF